MEVHRVDVAAAKEMLKTVYGLAAASASGRSKNGSASRKVKEPAPVALRLRLGETRNNIHCTLNKIIQRTSAEGARFDRQSKTAAAGFLGGHGFPQSVAGRRGMVLATLATIFYCNNNLEECTFPGGENGNAVVEVDLTSLVFVLSKIWIELVQVNSSDD